ncbi:HipA domain-containing protein [Bacteriovoracaceae bacterium]|nr:HipA domain-containing protein [Bacteriovoracaceae bacterium]
MKAKSLKIYLNTILVGTLTKRTDGQVSFKYCEEWIDAGFAISNSLPLQEDIYKGEIVSRYFDNLLPDNDEILKILASKFGAESTRSFDLLSVIGKDCVGALSFLLPGVAEPKDFEMNYSKLSNSKIEKRLKSLGSTSPLGMNDDEDFRISIAGAQEKTAFLNIDGKWQEPHGLTPTTHIFKTSIGALGSSVNFEDSIDNEWACLYLMKKMGLPVCETNIAKFGEQKVLVVKRFDRKWTTYKGKEVLIRIPQEDLCQALSISPYRKYQSEGGPGVSEIGEFLMASKNSEDRINFFKAIIVFGLLYATDGHGKNFSIFLEDDGFRLTPFYDVMSAYFLHKREKQPLSKLKLAMKVGNSGHYAFKRILRRHYQETAKMCSIGSDLFEEIMDDLKVKYENLDIIDKELDPLLNKETLDIILEGMGKRSKVLFY